MLKIRKIGFMVLLLSVLGCNKEVIIDLPPYRSKIIVDGWIEHNSPAQVLLTKSASYFGKIDSASLRDLILTRAKVSVSDGETTEILTLHPNHDYFPPIMYSGSQLKGELGKTYTLKIEYANQIVTAQTSIPPLPEIERIWFEEDNETPGKVILWARLHDNPSQKNYYRIFTRRKGKDTKDIPIQFPNYSDQSFNGESITIPLYRGERNIADSALDTHYDQGDTISVKVCTMDKTSYEYWENFQQELLNSKSPFATSNKTLQSNVNGNALGIWCGYGSINSIVIAKEE